MIYRLENQMTGNADSDVRRKNFHGGFKVGGPGGGAPRTPENCRKFAKKFPKKIAKITVLSHILQKDFKTIP